MTKHYNIERSQLQALSHKAGALARWLTKNAPSVETSQKHLDEGTVEQAYWHYGYLCAIRDVLAMVDSESAE
jgi:hypothetical protein